MTRSRSRLPPSTSGSPSAPRPKSRLQAPAPWVKWGSPPTLIADAPETSKFDEDALLDELLRRLKPIFASDKPTREVLHVLLDVALDVRDRAAAADKVLRQVAIRDVVILYIARPLLNGVFGWLAQRLPEMDTEMWQLLQTQAPEGDAAAEECRERFIRLLAETPHMLPIPALQALVDALRIANSGTGEVPPLFRPIPKQGQGENPNWARGLEAAMLMWIHYEKGRGRKIESAKHDVSQATILTTKAVEAWMNAWKARYGVYFVKSQLDWAREQGASGRPLSDGAVLRGFTSLEQLAEAWKAAKKPRKTVKPKS